MSAIPPWLATWWPEHPQVVADDGFMASTLRTMVLNSG